MLYVVESMPQIQGENKNKKNNTVNTIMYKVAQFQLPKNTQFKHLQMREDTCFWLE